MADNYCNDWCKELLEQFLDSEITLRINFLKFELSYKGG